MFIFLFVTAGIVILLFQFRQDVKNVYTAAGQKAAPIKTKVFPVPPHIDEILLKYFPYYKRLSTENKKKFTRKVARFQYSKRFVPRGVSEVTIEAKVLISASAVQLTFGLPDVYLDHFNKILVYPNDYYSSITKRYHKGEVNPMFGIVVLSWQSFVDGYIYTNDSVNLGLHEMAHALRLENIIRHEEYRFFDEDLIDQFDSFAERYCKDPGIDQTQFLRPYACTNVHEFFSVAIENFFERSTQFKSSLPELYSILSRLLNQDPILLQENLT